MSEQDDDHEPQNKRQKCGDDDAAAPEIIAFGGPTYDEATARKILQEEVLVFAEYAVDGEAVIGFDPDDAALDNVYEIETDLHAGNMTPMIYFARKGALKMCRYLMSRGASTTKSDDRDIYFPMYSAAAQGQLDACKLLYDNGAQNDIRRMNSSHSTTPFIVAAYFERVQVIRWLVLHGALCADNNSEDVEALGRIEWEKMPRKIVRSVHQLFLWAKEVTQSHSALVTFLGGTLPPASTDTERRCPLQCFSGYSGVRKHIFDFVGPEVTKRKQLRILRNVMEVLPPHIKNFEA